MKTIIISVTNDITTDQRVEKVCNTLHKKGYIIILVGRKLNNSINVERPYKTVRFKLICNKGALFYAEYNIRLFLFLLINKKDMLLANDLDTLLANYIVSKMQNKPLIFDSHELFSEVPELINKPKTKAFWQFLEYTIIPKLKNNYTVCNSIAQYYKQKYRAIFSTIYNVPNSKTAIKKNNLADFNICNTNKKIIIYQGALNIGRGLELMIKTMPLLDNFLLLIAGDGDITAQLKKQVSTLNLNDSVLFLGKLTPKNLHKITPNASIGISLEEDLGLNYKYALPNKIFDYIQAEVPILVSNLNEMRQIAIHYNVGAVVTNRQPSALAEQIKSMVKKDFSKPLKSAKKELIWENQEQKLLEIFKNAT